VPFKPSFMLGFFLAFRPRIPRRRCPAADAEAQGGTEGTEPAAPTSVIGTAAVLRQSPRRPDAGHSG